MINGTFHNVLMQREITLMCKWRYAVMFPTKQCGAMGQHLRLRSLSFPRIRSSYGVVNCLLQQWNVPGQICFVDKTLNSVILFEARLEYWPCSQMAPGSVYAGKLKRKHEAIIPAEARERGAHLTCTVSINALPGVIAQLSIWQCRQSLRTVSGQIQIEIVKLVKYMLTANCLKRGIACQLRKSRFDIMWFNLLN